MERDHVDQYANESASESKLILEFKKNVMPRADISEVYKVKIIVKTEVFYGLVYCYLQEEPNELSSSPYDCIIYVAFIFKNKEIEILTNSIYLESNIHSLEQNIYLLDQ